MYGAAVGERTASYREVVEEVDPQELSETQMKATRSVDTDGGDTTDDVSTNDNATRGHEFVSTVEVHT